MKTDDRLLSCAWTYLQDSAPVILLRFDRRYIAIDANGFTQARLGLDWRGKKPEEIFLFLERPLDLEEISRHPETPRILNAPTVTGGPETFRVHFYAVDDGFLAIGNSDVDEIMHLRNDLISLTNEMSSMTRELQKKNHDLAQLNELKNQFLGIAAHDLRKPVSAIVSYCEFLIDEVGSALDEEQHGFLKTILRSTELMRKVIDDFLDISMIEAGRFHISPVSCDIRGIVEESVSLHRMTARKNGVSIALTQEGAIPSAMLDPSKIEQVLNNLIANAIEHTPTGTNVGVHLSSDENGLLVKVSDSGEGIAPEWREKLFNPFARGNTNKARQTKSVGLGLAISKKIVDAHGGTIWIENNARGGAVFVFRLPHMRNQKENSQ